MTHEARDALARDLGQTTTMSTSTARFLIDRAVEAEIEPGRRLVEDDHVERVIRTWSQANIAGAINVGFQDFLEMMRFLGSTIGESAAGPITVRIVKDKGGPHGDG